ncbi:MASE1 domain-containing protein [Geobacter sp. FeAm09]|uniref:MASE1 domain-containing protein n=1 Tax=Geobacter sp. FeAm09 TaxID=2597769 RepID=UPI00143D392D|nr:MASE1 domain-containing protein [Geobacter sp. FeAm09]
MSTLRIALITCVYFLTAKLGLFFAFAHTNATPVWPASGVALALCLLFGRGIWPGIFLGALLANVTELAGAPFTPLSAYAVAVGTAAGNTLEALAATFLTLRASGGRPPLDRRRDAFAFILLGALASTTISASIGTAGYCLGSGNWVHWERMWLTWWLGDAVGIIVFVPLLLTWGKRAIPTLSVPRRLEAVLLLGLLLLVERLIFSTYYPLEYLIIPFLLWAALRFGQFESAVVVVIVLLTSLYWTARGLGPFAGRASNESLLFLQTFLGVSSVTALLLSCLTAERKRTEEALRSSEEKYRSIFENAPLGIFQSTPGGRFISVNGTLAGMFGYASPEETRDHITDIAGQIFVHPEQRHQIITQVREATGFVRDEVTYRRRDGSEFICNLYIRVVCADPEEAGFLEGFVEDISERKRAEEELARHRMHLSDLVRERTIELQEANDRLKEEIAERIRTEKMLTEREAQYRDLVENANSVIMRWLPDGRVVFFNAFAQHFFGYAEKEILGHRLADTILPARDSAGRDLSSLAADIVARPEAYARNENENMRKDGERVWVAWSNKAICDHQGDPVEILSIGVDITQLVQTEHELRTTLDDLAVAKERAEAADRLKSAFLATMSHELRTPLNSIIGFTGILLQGLVGPLNDEQKKQLGMVRGSADHLLSLISDVLDISKIEAGQLQVACEPFDLPSSIRRIGHSIRPLVEKKGLALTIEIGEDVAMINGDMRRVEQVLLNLLSNAVKFTEQGGISVTCASDADGYVTRVSDSGIGIGAADKERIFRPFYQIDTGLNRKYEGTGLGLSICKKLIELMGGAIWVENAPQQGTTFGFRLPFTGSPR